jgi:predicted nucleotide-binding protein (sugar kinase/HSP70/actin superfamily)
MDVLTECEVTHEFSGAMAVSVFFLSVFVALLVGDALLTQTALTRTLLRNEKEEEQVRRKTLDELESSISSAKVKLASVNHNLSTNMRAQMTTLGLESGLRPASVRPNSAV